MPSEPLSGAKNMDEGDLRWLREGCQCERLGRAEEDECIYEVPCPDDRSRAQLAAQKGATRRLTVVQRRHLVELADIRDEGNTGEAYFYPTGSQYRTAHTLMRLGFLRSADSAIRVYRLTDAGYEEARRGT